MPIRRLPLAALTLLLAPLATPAHAQQTVVHFKTLQQYLPTVEVSGFARGKPTGQTSSAMGMSVSEARVVYTSQAEPTDEMSPPEITVKITDITGTPAAGFAMMGMAFEVNEETEEGYQKSITLQGKYKGVERATTTEDNKSCGINVIVGNRFMVEIEASGTDDAAPLHKLLDSMKLDALEKVQPGQS